MKIRTLTCSAALALALSTAAARDARADECTYPSTTFVFGNGMFTPYIRAHNHRMALDALVRSAVAGTGLDGETIRSDLAYNENEPVISQLYEVATQKLQESPSGFWRMMVGLAVPGPELAKSMLELSVALFGKPPENDADLQQHVQAYRSAILEGSRVIVVPHSQGNLYANLAWKSLHSGADPVPPNVFALIGVAAPTKEIQPVSESPPFYVTAEEDWVINGVRTQFPDTLKGNVSNGPEPLIRLGHDFVDEYLKPGSASREKLRDLILARLVALDYPPQVVGAGPITVTLSWQGEPDVDLHIFEPTGAHVSYLNEAGNAGKLDKDDQDSPGLEHYYVACETIEVGTYTVALNYYFGLAPVTAQVQVAADNTLLGKSVELPAALGPLGDDSPIPVFEIEVKASPIQGYEYSILPAY